MMIGTAALPHILMRYYTTPSVRQARQSVFWSLFFIFLLYFTAPALAVLAKYDIYNFLVGSSFASLPAWVMVIGYASISCAVINRLLTSKRILAADEADGEKLRALLLSSWSWGCTCEANTWLP